MITEQLKLFDDRAQLLSPEEQINYKPSFFSPVEISLHLEKLLDYVS